MATGHRPRRPVWVSMGIRLACLINEYKLSRDIDALPDHVQITPGDGVCLLKFCP